MAEPLTPEEEAELRADAKEKAEFYPGDRRRMTGVELLSIFATLDAERAAHAETAAKALSIDRELMEARAAHAKTREAAEAMAKALRDTRDRLGTSDITAEWCHAALSLWEKVQRPLDNNSR